MANVQQFYTYDVGTANNFFSGIWMLTRCMKQAGWVYKSSSDGSAKDTTGTASNDKWGGGATPTSDTYPTGFSATNGPWWVASGPNVIKIPITAASTGTFVRGEQVTQTTSAATGELLGYVYDATNAGWLVILPRTGTFDGSNLITGAVSSATVTANGVVKTYTQEVCIWKNSAAVAQGSIYWIMADATGEQSSLFSYLAVNAAGATATVAPGGGGTNNGFPGSAIAVLGTGGSSSPSTWGCAGTITTHAIISATNATPAAGTSADGTFWIMMSNGASSINSFLGGLFRLDDGEPGDIAPFDWLWTQSTNIGSYNRTVGAGVAAVLTFNTFFGTGVNFNGYIARGVGGTSGSNPDIASYHKPAQPVRSTNSVFVENNADIIKVWNHPATNKPMAVDTVLVYSDKTNSEQIKGRTRWIRVASIGTLYDTTDGKTWVAWLTNSTTSNPTFYVGPWDASTTPAP